ncbi:hypothetical protein GCM10022224_086070 [Nonomuraea antimicrobica]|uniref:NYN domain-containing protein n=1 Tax=Nonomuraea antimicrobica TaxID=561173 RepID=A0ABP7DLG3_9ACTN
MAVRDGRTDVVMLVSADSDLCAAIDAIRRGDLERSTKTRVITVFPPKRRSASLRRACWVRWARRNGPRGEGRKARELSAGRSGPRLGEHAVRDKPNGVSGRSPRGFLWWAGRIWQIMPV